MSEDKKENIPQRCGYCKIAGPCNNYALCYVGNWLKVLLFGPERVRLDDWCNRFEYAKKYEARQRTRQLWGRLWQQKKPRTKLKRCADYGMRMYLFPNIMISVNADVLIALG